MESGSLMVFDVDKEQEPFTVIGTTQFFQNCDKFSGDIMTGSLTYNKRLTPVSNYYVYYYKMTSITSMTSMTSSNDMAYLAFSFIFIVCVILEEQQLTRINYANELANLAFLLF